MRFIIRFPINKRTIRLMLTDYYYGLSGGESDEVRISKNEANLYKLSLLKNREAIKIIRNQLRLYGFQGEYFSGFFEAADDVIEQRKFWEDKCSEWVDKNYPNLN